MGTRELTFFRSFWLISKSYLMKHCALSLIDAYMRQWDCLLSSQARPSNVSLTLLPLRFAFVQSPELDDSMFSSSRTSSSFTSSRDGKVSLLTPTSLPSSNAR